MAVLRDLRIAARYWLNRMLMPGDLLDRPATIGIEARPVQRPDWSQFAGMTTSTATFTSSSGLYFPGQVTNLALNDVWSQARFVRELQQSVTGAEQAQLGVRFHAPEGAIDGSNT